MARYDACGPTASRDATRSPASAARSPARGCSDASSSRPASATATTGRSRIAASGCSTTCGRPGSGTTRAAAAARRASTPACCSPTPRRRSPATAARRGRTSGRARSRCALVPGAAVAAGGDGSAADRPALGPDARLGLGRDDGLARAPARRDRRGGRPRPRADVARARRRSGSTPRPRTRSRSPSTAARRARSTPIPRCGSTRSTGRSRSTHWAAAVTGDDRLLHHETGSSSAASPTG